MKVLVYTVLLSIMVLVGCNDGTTPGSYQSIIMVNGTEYVLTQPENENVQYDRDKGIGKIERKVPIEQIPDTHLSSNELPKGTKIYSTIQDSEYIIAKRPDMDKELLYTLQKNLKSAE
ncbi:hypothetical protein MHI57_08000 [Cytobacillus sp. FSL K6-0129]|uniref:hypothetical protein n=1 Tax=Cytobacillus sp. FSL K6-0129 TaxID=2921421 RepID=UPI0030FBFFCF